MQSGIMNSCHAFRKTISRGLDVLRMIPRIYPYMRIHLEFFVVSPTSECSIATFPYFVHRSSHLCREISRCLPVSSLFSKNEASLFGDLINGRRLVAIRALAGFGRIAAS